jgi:hypothetical protein
MREPLLQLVVVLAILWFPVGGIVFVLWGKEPGTGNQRAIWGQRDPVLLIALWPLVLLQVAKQTWEGM